MITRQELFVEERGLLRDYMNRGDPSKMFRFGAFGNEGVILREAYVKELEQRIQRLEELMRINK